MMLSQIFKKFKKVETHNYILLSFFIFFIFQSIFFIFTIKPGFPPDENYHIELTILQKKDQLDPTIDNSENTYQYGDVNRIPFLYHAIMGLFLDLNFTKADIYIFLRVINLLISLISLTYIYKTANLISPEKKVAIFSLLLTINTLMYVFTSSSVNYDNLVNLLSIMSFYYLILFTKSQSIKHLISLYILLFAGILTKYSFLPLFLMIFFTSFLFIFKNKKDFFSNSKKNITKYKISFTLLSLSLILIVFAGYMIYGINYYRYKSFVPDCELVLGYENCLKSGLYKRNLDNKLKKDDSKMVNSFTYTKKWINTMFQRTYGINVWIINDTFTIIFSFLFISSLFLFIIKLKKLPNILIIIFIICIMYILILLRYNYKSYLNDGALSNGVQGRYLFPVLPMLYIIISYLFSLVKNKIAFIFIGFVYLLSMLGFIYYYKHQPKSIIRNNQTIDELDEKYKKKIAE